MKNQFMRAEEVARELEVSRSYAYRLIKQLNAELREKGYMTIAGRVNRLYFQERLYGTSEQRSVNRVSTHKDEKNGTWYVMVRYHDWKGTKRQKCKRGFATRREAQECERNFRLQTEGDPDMTFEAFLKLYENDMRPRLKENTWLSKEHMIRTKLFPTFGKKMLSEIETRDIIAWQNELLAYRDEKKQPYSKR